LVKILSGYRSVRVNLIQVGLGFGSNNVGFFFGFWVISGQVGFQILSSSGYLGFGLGWASGHLISGSLGFQVVSGRIRLGRVFFCDVLFWVGTNFGSSHFNFFFRNSL
jgi:hypothetical protein